MFVESVMPTLVTLIFFLSPGNLQFAARVSKTTPLLIFRSR